MALQDYMDRYIDRYPLATAHITETLYKKYPWTVKHNSVWIERMICAVLSRMLKKGTLDAFEETRLARFNLEIGIYTKITPLTKEESAIKTAVISTEAESST